MDCNRDAHAGFAVQRLVERSRCAGGFAEGGDRGGLEVRVPAYDPFIRHWLLHITNAGSPPGRITPLRQRLVEHLVLQQKAKRTVQAYTSWIYDLAKFHHRSPDQLGQPESRAWILHLITERKPPVLPAVFRRTQGADVIRDRSMRSFPS